MGGLKSVLDIKVLISLHGTSPYIRTKKDELRHTALTAWYGIALKNPPLLLALRFFIWTPTRQLIECCDVRSASSLRLAPQPHQTCVSRTYSHVYTEIEALCGKSYHYGLLNWPPSTHQTCPSCTSPQRCTPIKGSCSTVIHQLLIHWARPTAHSLLPCWSSFACLWNATQKQLNCLLLRLHTSPCSPPAS